MKRNKYKQESTLKISNGKELMNKEFDMGGNWACILGCGSFCILGGGSTSYLAVVATAL